MRKGRSFEEWLARVDVWLFAKIGLSHRDLPDIDYLSMYEDGEAPALAGRAAIRYAGDC